jgi:uncharacterized protein YneR
MKTRFYDVHVFFSRQDGYSVGVKIESVNPLSEEQVIEFAADNQLFTDDGDQNHVDYVEEIDESEYNLLTA